ncbi:MAG TPA: P1 family peptidase [Longimicrobiales bacterium]|nr:P1 family peptidase [Longimicrobiales bacterium]
MSRGITAVPGVEVGHARVPGGDSGCTVLLGPFRGAVEVRGLATGSRELPTLSADHVVPRVDAILLTGGSAFGLAAADGVMAWLSERGRGYDTGVAPVPIVPTAVVFDLREGRARPDASTGRAACDAAGRGPVAEGRVGAGAGTSVGKLAGRERASVGGVGTWAVESRGYTVGALAVVNAVGDVRDADGRIVAGARGDDGAFMDAERWLREGAGPPTAGPPAPGTNTTLAVVATDAPLPRVDLGRLARMAANALSRRITPVHTPFDGDVVFAVSTADSPVDLDRRDVLALGTVAQHVLEEAITRAVTAGDR